MQKGYYAIIPANVRYDKSLNANAKLLYGEITALSNEKGYCWAGNEYFASLYGVSKTSISKWVRRLADSGYVKVELEYKEGTKQILKRHITLVIDPVEDKLKTPIEDKLKDNNTGTNTTLSITVNNENHFESFWSVYPRKVNKAKTKAIWMKLSPDEELITKIANNLLERECRGGWTKDNMEFILHPTTYLNGARWEDEITPTTNGDSALPLTKGSTLKKRDITEALTDRSWAN
ncbi:MAG: helix-turn-helix domain-containing protein [Porticoccaceae bacterium]|nr:helix-turn-helix domain-containing protein [Porticoccaceae bacterium]